MRYLRNKNIHGCNCLLVIIESHIECFNSFRIVVHYHRFLEYHLSQVPFFKRKAVLSTRGPTITFLDLTDVILAILSSIKMRGKLIHLKPQWYKITPPNIIGNQISLANRQNINNLANLVKVPFMLRCQVNTPLYFVFKFLFSDSHQNLYCFSV